MEEKNTKSETPAEQPTPSAAAPKKKSPFKWILLIVFAAIILNVIRTQEKSSVAWQDYDTGIKLAKENDKPILISFYKESARMCREMWKTTFANKNMINFIENNFVPIMVDVDQQPELAKEYEVSYYPTHFIKTPDNSKILKTRRAGVNFMPFMLEALENMDRKPK